MHANKFKPQPLKLLSDEAVYAIYYQKLTTEISFWRETEYFQSVQFLITALRQFLSAGSVIRTSV